MDTNNSNQELRKVVAQLESKVDQLEAELIYLNKLLVEVGFPEGIKTLKASAEELLAEEMIHQENRNAF